MKRTYSGLFLLVLFGVGLIASPAQAAIEDGFYGFTGDENIPVVPDASTTSVATTSDETASATAANIINQQRTSSLSNDLTRPEELPEKVAIFKLLEARPVTEPGIFNALAFWVQEAVRQGIPANTIFLVLLTPFLALMVSFVRVVIGLPTLDMLVPIALSFALVAIGITVGLLVLAAILFASYVSKRVLSRLRIMFYPKRALSMLLLALSVFAALSIGVVFEVERILTVPIFPILIMMLLGDMIISVQLHKSSSETFSIITSTLGVGLVGYLMATSDAIQNTLILYPEIVLSVVPLNILIGRYFGLRALEVLRFNKVATD